MYMWRAADSEGEVLEILVQPQRDKAAALQLLRKLLRRQGFVLVAWQIAHEFILSGLIENKRLASHLSPSCYQVKTKCRQFDAMLSFSLTIIENQSN